MGLWFGELADSLPLIFHLFGQDMIYGFVGCSSLAHRFHPITCTLRLKVDSPGYDAPVLVLHQCGGDIHVFKLSEYFCQLHHLFSNIWFGVASPHDRIADQLRWMVLALGTAAMYLPHQHPKFLELIKQPFVKVMQMIAGIIDGTSSKAQIYAFTRAFSMRISDFSRNGV